MATTSGSHRVAVSEELYAPIGNDVELCYQTFGEPDDEPLLMVMGLSAPMTWWDASLCEALAREGHFVIRFDNRDVGRSTKIRAAARRDHLLRAFATGRANAPYSIADMAGDAVALLDHLGIESAHVVGASMGGMIAQTITIDHPTRVRSLTSIMSTTGRRTVGWQSPTILPMLIAPRRPGREPYIRASAALWRLIGSPEFPTSMEDLRARAGETFDRGFDASGVIRQTLAILSQPDRSSRLRSVRVPTLVIHGQADKMVHVSGGRSTAAAIPDAELILIDGMGHDLPTVLHDQFVLAITRTTRRASH